MAIFNSYVSSPEGTWSFDHFDPILTLFIDLADSRPEMTALAAELERLAGPGSGVLVKSCQLESQSIHMWWDMADMGVSKDVKSREVVDGIVGPTDSVIGALGQYCTISKILVPQTAQDL